MTIQVTDICKLFDNPVLSTCVQVLRLVAVMPSPMSDVRIGTPWGELL